MKVPKALSRILIGIGCVLTSFPAKADWPPQVVVNGVYAEIQKIHGNKATPQLIWGFVQGSPSPCGPIYGSNYCPSNHTVYIPMQDIQMAYQYGDAALAYIIGHEYAHAMQTAYGFNPSLTPISELQADCLAGVYLGLIPGIGFDQRDILKIQALAYRVGDYTWGSRHHGTPEERVKSVTWGLQGALNGKSVTACFVN